MRLRRPMINRVKVVQELRTMSKRQNAVELYRSDGACLSLSAVQDMFGYTFRVRYAPLIRFGLREVE